ncbi:formylglycine-generating enzyme family protein [Lysinibacter sp. HNR]|uniref:formylglycine-generating enzyme family protein n=1 Tax=Lysinibacter sp. HNR TaxID=3031408 RepID=UPI002434C243|nr:formylglycine-generating enzyme family protein [Lysinibacter sp. HNR]WGD36244.1 formylglycine-generating enzyme family protein [Lysinibacter sp. HNR]
MHAADSALPQNIPDDMIKIPGGTFLMGSNRFYPEERPVHQATVSTFLLDKTAVTNELFARFVQETGYVTTAEQRLNPDHFNGAPLTTLEPGSLVFTPTSGPVNLNDWRQWWRWVHGADWKHPFGPKSSIEGKEQHPVVQVSFADARAYAQWAGKRLPTETEWEFAARGGLEGQTYAWGDTPQSPEYLLANTWQGKFPYQNRSANGWVGSSPVSSFRSNGYGLFDMIGNVWEWTSTPWSSSHRTGDETPTQCSCSPRMARTPRPRVIKGGSHLCSPEYCFRYRPSARSEQTEDSATTHIGFRCARSLAF